jgi:hypothetical protein
MALIASAVLAVRFLEESSADAAEIARSPRSGAVQLTPSLWVAVAYALVRAAFTLSVYAKCLTDFGREAAKLVPRRAVFCHQANELES